MIDLMLDADGTWVDPNQRTPAERAVLHAAEVRAVEAALPVPLRRPDGETRLVHHTHVQARLDAGWTR